MNAPPNFSELFEASPFAAAMLAPRRRSRPVRPLVAKPIEKPAGLLASIGDHIAARKGAKVLEPLASYLTLESSPSHAH